MAFAAGITETGFAVPTTKQIYDLLAARWRESTGKELRDNKPEGQFMKIIAEQLSNKGFSEQDVQAIWPELLDVFYSGFISKAAGISLDYLVKLRLTQGRRPASAAAGSAWAKGEPGVEVVAGGLTLQTKAGVTFTNRRAFEINSAGMAFFPVAASASGAGGNVAAGSLTALNLPAGITEAGNTAIDHEIVWGAQFSEWFSLPADEATSRYQVFTLSGYDMLKSAKIKVKNPAAVPTISELSLAFYTDDTQQLLARTALQRVVLAAGAERTVTFDVGIDTYGVGAMRCVPLLVVGSDELQISLGAGTGWHVGGLPQNRALALTLQSGAGGAMSGGSDAEEDESLRRRHWEGLYTPGWGNPEAVRARLSNLPGVMWVRLEVNDTLLPRTQHGLLVPGKGIGVVVWGGNPDEIAKELYQSVPVGTELGGNISRSVTGANGQIFPIKFYRPAKRVVKGVVWVQPSEQFPVNGIAEVKDALVKYIGGLDSTMTEHAGVSPGGTVFHSQALAAIHKRISGVLGIEILWGFSGDELVEDDLVPLLLEKPYTTPSEWSVHLRGGER